jgi:N-acetylmuramic acid 6-phosphate etherase
MPTETADSRYAALEHWPVPAQIAAMYEGQLAAVAAVGSQVAAIAAAASAATARLRDGAGRLTYAGAGTSARIAVQDGVELVPTFGWPSMRLHYLIAGGTDALLRSVEGAEDDAAAARDAVAAAALGADDVLIGVAASGRTPYTIAAVTAARANGALTIAIANNPESSLLAAAEHPILIDTGAEVVAGSTRMKAGTAQKAVLNLFSTAVMIGLGRVANGRMVDMQVTNDKLEARAIAMVAEQAGVDAAIAARALAAAGRDIRRAIVLARG